MDFTFLSDYAFWIGFFVSLILLLPVVGGRMNADEDDLEEQARRMVEDEEQKLYDNHQ